MTGPGRLMAEREAEVRTRLSRVTDPELDEPVTELGFVTGVAIDMAGGVSIGFRLPTYWCAANFAFMMADDIRREVGTLPWVMRVDLTLDAHMYAEEINRGMARGLSFRETFGADASGDLQEVRRTFLVKAFQRRQEAVLRYLLATDRDPAALVVMTVSELQALRLDPEGQRLRERYLDRRGIAGPGSDCPNSGGPGEGESGGDRPAFVDARGMPLVAADLPAYLQGLARVGINAEFNGALCRALLAARYGNEQAPLGNEPTLLDFARMPPGEKPRTGPQT